MSQTGTLFDAVWKKLSDGMDNMFQFQTMTINEFTDLYNTVHKYFISPECQETLLKASSAKVKPVNDPKKNSDQSNNENNVQVDTNIPGGEMYFNVKRFLKENLEKIAQEGNHLQGEDLLRFYVKIWEKYQFLSLLVNGLFSYMNFNWVKRQRESNIPGVYEVYTVAMEIWQELFFKQSNQSLTQTCLNLIKAERNKEHIDNLLIKEVVKSYLSIGFTEADKKSKTNRTQIQALTTYKECFEKQYIEDTEQFYRFESNDYISKNSTINYLKKITERLEEEQKRIESCLHRTTLDILCPKLEEILIKTYLDPIYAESKTLLRDEKIEDLGILFKLVNRLEKANEPIQQDFKNYVYETGMSAINCVSTTAIQDPKVYVETIIDVHKKFFRILEKSFYHEQGYKAALDEACSKFINNNAVTKAVRTTNKSPELLARYCDALLRRGNKVTNENVEEKIDQIMIVFNYIEDKDVFQKFYGKLLAKRLVGQLSASDDYEETMISKLKEACGFEYASKLQRMFQDIRVSTTLIEPYQAYCENKQFTNIVDFSVMVLSSNSWPFTAPLPFNLSRELEPTFVSFTEFYINKFNGRKLEWLYQHSKGDLQTLHTKSKYILHVSTYQMVILLLFNENPKMTVERMQDKTQIETELFLQVLFGLLKSKVLICTEIAGDDFKENDIKMTYNIQIDTDFKSKKIKINLNQPIKSVEQKDTDTVNQAVEDERKILIQAAIVRIMKARKELKQALLIQEVIPQLTSRFKPEVSKIKKCIELLIEKEYLERNSTERDLFRYLA